MSFEVMSMANRVPKGWLHLALQRSRTHRTWVGRLMRVDLWDHSLLCKPPRGTVHSQREPYLVHRFQCQVCFSSSLGVLSVVR